MKAKKPMLELAIGTALAGLVYGALQGLNVMPVVFAAGLLFMIYHTQGLKNLGGAAGGTRQKVVAAPSATVAPIKFDDIGGQAAAKKELVEALDFMVNKEAIKRLGIRPLKGILLTGPPGTGKTLLAKAAANYTDSIFLTASGAEFIEMYAGVGAQRVRDLFRKAREAARKEKRNRAIIFIDEIEVVGGKRGRHQSHMEYDQTINQLLTEMDGIVVDDEVQVLVMAATNRVELLDDALTRPGRFDRIVNVDLPDREGRRAILALHTRNKPLAEGVDLDQTAKETFGFSGAHLESLCNEAAILAMREAKEQIEQKHLTEAVDKVMLGEVMDRRPSADEKRRVAIHEAGHALVGEWVNPGSVASVTVTPRGRAMGYVRSHDAEDRYLYTREQLEHQIQVCLAGSCAEQLVLGNRSTGASNDFEKATKLARQIVVYGLSELGVVDENTLDKGKLHEKQQEILKAQEAKVEAFLESKRAALEAVATVLLEVEAIGGDELRQQLAA